MKKHILSLICLVVFSSELKGEATFSQLSFIEQEEVKGLFKSLPKVGDPGVLTGEGHWNTGHIAAAKEIMAITQPKQIVQLGFNAGHSAVLWLYFSNADVLSVDIGLHDVYKKGIEVVGDWYPNRIQFITSDTRYVYPMLAPLKNSVDLIMIDADHSYQGILRELDIAIKLNASYILMDDTHDPITQKGMRDFPHFCDFELIKQWDVGEGVHLYKNHHECDETKIDQTQGKKQSKGKGRR